MSSVAIHQETIPPPTSGVSFPGLPTALLLLGWCGFLFFYGLTAGEFYRTESLRAILAAELLRSGNWVVPTLYGQPLLTKPPGMYVAIALVSSPFGHVNEWTARLPSALAATATVLLFFWYFRRQLGRAAGLVAAGVLPVSVLWLDRAPSAEIDMLQVAWVTAAILCFLRALEVMEESPRPAGAGAWLWWLAALAGVAGGVLTKWTAPVFFYGTVVPLLCWRGRLRLLFGRHHLVCASLAGAVYFAWVAAAAGQVGWGVFYGAVLREALQHLSFGHRQEVIQHLSPGHQAHLQPWAEVLVHPLKLLAMNLPWSALALLTLWPGFGSRLEERGRRLLQALHCWTWPNLLFWSMVPAPSPRQSLPLFPGLAGLAALVWWAWIQGRLRWPWPRVAPGRVLVGLLICWLVVKLAFVHVVVPSRNPQRQPRAKGEQLATVVPAGATLYLFRVKDEGIMFYYHKAVRRLADPGQLPSSSPPVYCILDAIEERNWPAGWPKEAVLRLEDEQGAPLVVVKSCTETGR